MFDLRVPVSCCIQAHQAVVDNTRNRTRWCRSPQAPRQVGVAHHTTHTSQHAGRPASRQSLARLHGAHEVPPALLSHTVEALPDGFRYNIAFVSACNLLQLVRYIPLECKFTFGVQQKPCGLCLRTPDLSLQLSICNIQQKRCSSISLTLLSPSGLFVKLMHRGFWHDPKRLKRPYTHTSKRFLHHTCCSGKYFGMFPQTLSLRFSIRLHSSGTQPR
jgi:hypothetical protein